MRFGFIVPHNYGLEDPQDVVGVARKAEELGYDSVWVNHHVLHAGYILDRLGDAPYYDALTLLTWVAAVTDRVRLGTTVIVLPYLNPLVLAKTIATLDVMSRGRVNLGIGVGNLKQESDSLARDFHNRGRYTDEGIAVMRELWTAIDPVFDGEFFSFSGVKFSPKPVQQPGPPVLIGGHSAAAHRRAALLGDGWHPMGLDPEQAGVRMQPIRDMANAAGRDGSALDLSIRLELRVANDGTEGVDSPMSGRPEELARTIEQYEAQGVNELVLSVSTSDVDFIHKTMDAFAEKVMSRVR